MDDAKISTESGMMDLKRLNDTARKAGPDGLIGVPEYIVRTFFPGVIPFLVKSPRVARSLSLFVALWWFGPTAFWRLKNISDQISSYFISSVSINSDEDLFEFLVRWLESQSTVRSEQSLLASLNSPKPKRPGWGRQSDDASQHEDPRNIEIQYEANHGMQWVFFRRRLFFFNRRFGEGNVYNGMRSHKSELVTLSCLGRSPKPVKDLLEHVYRQHKDKEKSLTIIRRPYGASFGQNGWARISQKPRRAIDTVILDPTQKTDVIEDIQSYMKTETQAWYGARGIPYRRGYLFHGPPGTGKTSLAMAVAGHFGLDIYVTSLLDQAIGDSELIGLFNTLPPRCLLLLEDIDTVGLSRNTREDGPKMPAWMKVAATKGDEENTEEDDDNKGQVSRVSLSGLLNAIDGVAAPEGHILIMTTNKPDKLDEALVRSGRISVRVKFESATKGQAKDIFMRMFGPDGGFKGEEARRKILWEKKEGSEEKKTDDTIMEEDLMILATKFADQIPEHEFSPADLQDYLLMRKKEPERAVEEVEAWKVEVFKERQRKQEEKAKRSTERAEKAQAKMKEIHKEMAGDPDSGPAGVESVAENTGEKGKTGDSPTGDA